MKKILVTSDTHFWHHRILEFCPKSRPCKDVEEMNETLIYNWNSLVKPQDTIIHVGDVSWAGSDKTNQILNRLNGKIILVLGNHDHRKAMEKTCRFESVNDYLELHLNGQDFIFFHYPIFEWNKIHRGSIHLYGHVHGRELSELPSGKSLDVGIDNRPNHDMCPWTLEEITEYMKTKPVRNHH